MDDRTKSTANYDIDFEQKLVAGFFQAITEASLTADNVVAISTVETLTALLKMLALILALSPCARSPSILNSKVADLAVRLRRLTREALDNDDFQNVTERMFFGGGHA
jgi:hypothetical protein